MHALCSENGDRLEIRTTPKNLADAVSLNQALGEFMLTAEHEKFPVHKC